MAQDSDSAMLVSPDEGISDGEKLQGKELFRNMSSRTDRSPCAAPAMTRASILNDFYITGMTTPVAESTKSDSSDWTPHPRSGGWETSGQSSSLWS
jgi:hypothetical protein